MSTAIMNESNQEALPELMARLQQEFAKLRQRVQELEAENQQLAKERGQLAVALSKALVTDEELDRRSAQKGGRSLQEIMARLEKLSDRPQADHMALD